MILSRFFHSAIIALILAPALLQGIQTRSVIHETYADFQGGELTDLSLHRDGRLRLAPTASEFASLVEPIIWSAVFGPEGDLFVAAGNKGRVYRISTTGDVSEFATTEEVFIRALAIGKDGQLYLGSSPEGKVYRVDAEGELEVFFEPRETYIWALLFNDNGDLFVATGDKGRIYRVAAGSEPGTSGELYFETEETHISTLVQDEKGHLLAGTAPNGHLYRIENREKAFLLFNSPDEEIRQIIPDPSGDLFVATFSKKKTNGPSGTVAEAVASLSSNSASGDSGSEPEEGVPSGTEPTQSNQQPGTLYRVHSDGFFESYWGLNGVSIYSLLRSPENKLLVGTGADGRIFSLENSHSWELRQRLPTGSEVTALLTVPGSDDVVALTSNPGRIFKLHFELPEKGEFISEVFDAKQIAKWGRFYAENLKGGGGGIQVSVRTGNSKKADSAWSDWIEITDSNPTDSPHPARYLQYRLTLSNSETEVRRVRFFYRHTNAAPKITAIRVVTGGLGFEHFPLPPQQGSVDLEQLFRPSNNNSNSSSESRQQLRAFEKPGVVTIAWKARDPNNDQLRFRVKLRRAEDPAWKTIGDDLDAHFLSFDSNGMDEGFYQAKIIASDHLSNPIAEARTGERLSERFLIDNSAPEIEVEKIEISGKDATI
ncbi:MAG TPA: hypothetical protein VK041_00125, partial [Opitutales bacterium]|nr:hypothetical protein [Opitutales bacterium]